MNGSRERITPHRIQSALRVAAVKTNPAISLGDKLSKIVVERVLGSRIIAFT